ncbi:MAG TPA: DHA2 family efflux MFS transporter permease subunit [Solirubrobacteraceae bacterium]
MSDVTAHSGSEPEPLDRETLVVAGVVMLGAIMSILDTTVVNVAIAHLAVAFHATLTTIQWVITGYTLALAAVIPLSGWAADRFGTKRIYMTSLVLFTLGSIASGLAWSAESLIVFRVLQGIGGGLIMPTVMTIMTRKAGPHRMGRVMGILGVPMLIAPIMGPILGGWLVDDVSWRWIFFINVPIGVVAFILALLVLDPDEPQPAHRLDWLGMALLSPGLAVFIYGLAESSTYGFGSLRAWGPTAAGGLLIATWFAHSWRTANPLIDIRTFVHTRAGYAAASFFLFAISVFGTMLLVPLYFQTVRGASALDAGLLMAPGGLGAMLLMPLSGKLTDRYGPTWLPATGLPLVAIGLIPFVFIGARTPYWVLCAGNFVQGLGMGLAMMPNMTAAMQAVPRSAIARTSTAMNIIRQAGASIGTAILSVILASAISSSLPIASARASGTGSGGLGALQHLPARAHALIAGPLADAFASTFVWALVMIVIAFIPAAGMALSGRRARARGSVTARPLAAE